MGAVLSFSGPPHRRRLPWGAGCEAPYVLCLLPGHGHQGVSSAPRAARFASCPWLESICYRRRTRALKSAAGAQIRGSGSSGLAARPRSRRCSECCDSIHPPAGHIYQCVPSFERAEHEIAVCWQLGEQRTGGAAIQRTGGAAALNKNTGGTGRPATASMPSKQFGHFFTRGGTGTGS